MYSKRQGSLSCSLCGETFDSEVSLILHFSTKHCRDDKDIDGVSDGDDSGSDGLESDEEHDTELTDFLTDYERALQMPQGSAVVDEQVEDGNSLVLNDGIDPDSDCDSDLQVICQETNLSQRNSKSPQRSLRKKTKLVSEVHLERNPVLTSNIFQCPFCSVQIKLFRLFCDHVRLHTKEEPYFCEDCDMSFGRVNYLRKHRTRHRQWDTMYQCSLCSKRFQSEEELQKHHDLQHKKRSLKTLQCPFCTYTVKSVGIFNRHLATHSARIWQCTICKITFNRLDNFKFHRKRAHHNSTPSIQQTKTNGGSQAAYIKTRKPKKSPTHSCPICRKVFLKTAGLGKHLNSHEELKTLKCHICRQGFRLQCQLDMHIRQHEKCEAFPCAECNASFYSDHLRKRHVNKEHSKRKIVPELC